jgi:hypothetical protein
MAQISVEDAFPTFQKRCGELFEQNLLLTAQVDTLERRLATAEAENTRLRDQTGCDAEPTEKGHPVEPAYDGLPR